VKQDIAEAGRVTPEVELDSRVGWLQVLAAFVTLVALFGVAYSFGAFFEPMGDELGVSKGLVAGMFSVATLLYFTLGIFTGRIADRIGARPVMVTGAIVMAVGLLATSRVNSIWLGFITYGTGVGIGVACGYVPLVASVGGWFERKRTTALGIAVAGIGLGTLIGAPLADALIIRYGWRDTYVIFAFGSLVIILGASLLVRRPPSHAVEARPLGEVVRLPVFVVLYASMALLSFALFVPFVFMAQYATDHGIDSGAAAVLIGLIGLTSVIGRLSLGTLAARLGSIQLYRICFLILSLSFGLWLVAGDSYPVLVAFVIIMGTAYGGFIALAPAVAAGSFGANGLGGVLGALYTAAGLGGLIGPPVTGAIIDRFSYDVAIWLAILISLASTAILAHPALRSPRGD